LFLAPDDRFDFVCFKLRDGEALYFSIVEAAALTPFVFDVTERSLS
jgi:hypothetical protein